MKLQLKTLPTRRAAWAVAFAVAAGDTIFNKINLQFAVDTHRRAIFQLHPFSDSNSVETNR